MKNQKSLFVLLAGLLICTFSYSQDLAIEYTYDAAGNRIQRKVITLDDNPPTEFQRPSATSASVPEPIRDIRGAYTFMLYPNPTTSTVRIQSDNAFQESTNRRLLVTDLSGKTLIDRPFVEITEEIDFSKHARGEYLVKVFAGGNAEGQPGLMISEWKVVKI